MPRSHNNVTIHTRDWMDMTYTNTKDHTHTVNRMGQGRADHSLDGNEVLRELRGFTNPNLHRRVTTKADREVHSNDDEKEYTSRDYELEIAGVHSYRAITHPTHLENSIDDETP